MSKAFIDYMIARPQPLVYFIVSVNSTCCEFPKDWPSYNNTKALDTIRANDILVYVTNDDYAPITVVYDQSSQSAFQSQLNVGRTLFVCFTLIIVTLLFTRDV